jgi:SOS-response transcriptional repressor LexA
MSMGLTSRQIQLLGFLRSYYAAHGIAPSIEEMQAHLGNKSKSGAHRIILALEERGAIRRLPFKSRAIELVDNNPRHKPMHPIVTIKLRADGYYLGADQSGDVEVRLARQ